jgi:hypothetical protein
MPNPDQQADEFHRMHLDMARIHQDLEARLHMPTLVGLPHGVAVDHILSEHRDLWDALRHLAEDDLDRALGPLHELVHAEPEHWHEPA